MQIGPGILVCTATLVVTTGCITRTVEIRPVAPVAESRAVPVGAGRREGAPQFSGATGSGREESASVAEQAPPGGVQVEAVIPGMSSRPALSIETESPRN